MIPELNKITPRDYQCDAYAKLGESIRNYTGPVFIDASVGAGKTIVMGAVLKRVQELNKTALVLARRGELVEQNAETFWDCGVKNSIYSASAGVKSTHYPMIVGSEGTVARALNSDLKNFNFDFLLVDECHEVDYKNDDCQYMLIINELLRRNKNLRILGFTGSPFRGDDSIVGEFWQKCVYKISTSFLVDRGFLVPTIFGYGHDEIRYDLNEFHIDAEKNSDYTQKELLAMQRKLTADSTATQLIMAEVVELTKDRNAVMITGAGKKHLEQIAECLPDDSYIIITESTGSKKRREGLKEISDGKKKYILQVGCLTTGYDEPLIDTSVLLRKIGSLTLLIQLLGRGMRLLKPKHKEKGLHKIDHSVLDYTDTMAEMAGLYNDPILDGAEKQRAVINNDDLIVCPACNTQNSPRARRCIYKPEKPRAASDVLGVRNFSIDGRCEWFWNSKTCEKCDTKNDTTARECRKCDHVLIDPNKNLTNKHYTDDDWREVKKMEIASTKNKEGLLVFYHLSDGEKATEIFWPESRKRWAKAQFYNSFIKSHLHKGWHPKARGMGVTGLVRMQAMFDAPTHITHRKGEKGYDIIHRKRFRSGREVK